MPQKQKATTKKGMKKSINNLYNTLIKEKTKHTKASNHVGNLKRTLYAMNAENIYLRNKIYKLETELNEAYNKEEHTSNIMADLVTRISNKK